MSDYDLSAKMQERVLHTSILHIRTLAGNNPYGLKPAAALKLIHAFSDMMHNLHTDEKDNLMDDYWWLRFHKMDGRVYKPVHHLPEFNIVWNWVYDYIRKEHTNFEYYIKLYNLR